MALDDGLRLRVPPIGEDVPSGSAKTSAGVSRNLAHAHESPILRCRACAGRVKHRCHHGSDICPCRGKGHLDGSLLLLLARKSHNPTAAERAKPGLNDISAIARAVQREEAGETAEQANAARPNVSCRAYGEFSRCSGLGTNAARFSGPSPRRRSRDRRARQVRRTTLSRRSP